MTLAISCMASFCLGWLLCAAFGRESRLQREAELERARALTAKHHIYHG